MKYRILIVLTAIAALLIGCSSIQHRNDPGVSIDTERVKYGESAYAPLNNSDYWNGQPMDMRRSASKDRWSW